MNMRNVLVGSLVVGKVVGKGIADKISVATSNFKDTLSVMEERGAEIRYNYIDVEYVVKDEEEWPDNIDDICHLVDAILNDVDDIRYHLVVAYGEAAAVLMYAVEGHKHTVNDINVLMYMCQSANIDYNKSYR